MRAATGRVAVAARLQLSALIWSQGRVKKRLGLRCKRCHICVQLLITKTEIQAKGQAVASRVGVKVEVASQAKAVASRAREAHITTS